MSMRTEKEKLLVATYNAMPTTEIQRRLNSGQLTLIATDIAQTILKSRFGAAVNEPSLTPDKSSGVSLSGKRRNWTPLRLVGALLIFGLITGLLSFPLQSRGPFFMVIFLFVLPGVAAVIGKSFRTLGLSVGWALVSTPVWLGIYLWHSGAFIFKGGDFNPLGALVSYFFISLFPSSQSHSEAASSQAQNTKGIGQTWLTSLTINEENPWIASRSSTSEKFSKSQQ